MSWIDSLRNAYSPIGETLKDRELIRAEIDFDKLLRTSPNAAPIVLGGKETRGHITRRYQSQYQTDMKLLAKERGKCGALVQWKDGNFIILQEEKVEFEVHSTYTMRECNRTISFSIDNNKFLRPGFFFNFAAGENPIDVILKRFVFATPNDGGYIIISSDSLPNVQDLFGREIVSTEDGKMWRVNNIESNAIKGCAILSLTRIESKEDYEEFYNMQNKEIIITADQEMLVGQELTIKLNKPNLPFAVSDNLKVVQSSAYEIVVKGLTAGQGSISITQDGNTIARKIIEVLSIY